MLGDRTTSRRTFLTAGLMGSAAAFFSPGVLTGASPRPAAAPASPREALDRLTSGNARVVAGAPIGPNRGLDHIAGLAPSQSPFAAVLSCADSRVPPELLFDQGYGDIFVVRVAGNVATPEEIASLEFAVAALGASFILVLGHSECGAVKAAMGSDVPPGQISSLFQHIAPALDEGEGDAARAIAANARHQMEVIRRGSPLLAQALGDGRIGLGAGVYDLGTARVDVLHTVGV